MSHNQPEKAETALIEQWFLRAVAPYGAEATSFLARERDPFRNPAGQSLRENLAILLDELLGAMDAARISIAVESIVRLRAVQELSAAQAVAFVFQLRPVLRDAKTPVDSVLLDDRIDQLALLVFEEYMRRREQVAELRRTEGLRAVRRPSAWRVRS